MSLAEPRRQLEHDLGRAQIQRARLNQHLLADPRTSQQYERDLDAVESLIVGLEAQMSQQGRPAGQPLRIFLGSWPGDARKVRPLYNRLREDGFEPWLEAEDVTFPNRRQREIAAALAASDVVIVCLSNAALKQADYLNEQLTLVQTALAQQGEENVFVLLLDQCRIPSDLGGLGALLYEDDEDDYQRLFKVLERQAGHLGISLLAPTHREDRFLDAALPGRVVKGVETELVVMLRLADSEGLAGLLGAQPQKFSARPEDVQSDEFVAEFERDERGGIRALELLVSVQTNDFDVLQPQQKIKLQAARDSKPLVFLVTPHRLGQLRLKIDVLVADETQLISGFLRVSGVDSTDGKPSEMALASVALQSTGAMSDEALLLEQAEGDLRELRRRKVYEKDLLEQRKIDLQIKQFSGQVEELRELVHPTVSAPLPPAPLPPAPVPPPLPLAPAPPPPVDQRPPQQQYQQSPPLQHEQRPITRPPANVNKKKRTGPLTLAATMLSLVLVVGVIGVVFSSVVGQGNVQEVNAFTIVRASTADARNGTVLENTEDDEGGQNATAISNGDFLAFNNVNFGNPAAGPPRLDLLTLNRLATTTQTRGLQARIASGLAGRGVRVGLIEFWVDGIEGKTSTRGTRIGQVIVNTTGGWQNWQTVRGDLLARVSGKHTLYLHFISTQRDDFVNLNWFQFIR